MESAIDRIILFFVVSGWIFFISRRSLRDRSSHGFYRFFAWESILAQFLINVPKWFADPFSVLQICSWVLLSLSVVVLAMGVHTLRSASRSGISRQDESLYKFEQTTSLVTSGIYRFIRHPMYASLLFLAWGIFFKDTDMPSSLLVIASTMLMVTTAKKDEEECLRFFGPAYQEYMSRSKMFVPFVF